VAHPDDETIFCGGTLARLAARGVAVHVVCLTRGEGGEVGEPPLCSRAELGAVREREMVCAVGKLGGKSLTFLDYVDPPVGPDDTLSAPEHDPVMLAGQIVNSLKQFTPGVVLTHGSDGEYGHPAHQLAHTSVLAAVASLKEAALLMYSFAATYPAHPYPRLANVHDSADVIVDVSDFLDQKEAAALCHATQTALFVRRRSQQAGRQLSVRDVLLAEESFHRHWPTEAAASDSFLEWIGTQGTHRN
jgi:LmbE family N-acetylglucosaminyl deacetylase